MGLIDDIVPEPSSGAHANPLEAAAKLKEAIWRNLEELKQLSPQQRQELRYEKFRNMGRFETVSD